MSNSDVKEIKERIYSYYLKEEKFSPQLLAGESGIENASLITSIIADQNILSNKLQKIYLATDHAGFELKEKIADYLNNVYEFEIVDCGSYEYNDKDDYTDFIHKAGKELSGRL